ncbi:MAG: hypothetical protein GX775_00930 [Erysipelothrix sp.]|nr:hypothetical protein [Erysipelothrix sp.]
MIFKRQDLHQLAGSSQVFEEQLEFDLTSLKHSVLRQLENVEVSGQFNYDEHDDHVYLTMVITGDMILPESLTNEDVRVPFESVVNETISFNSDIPEDDSDILVVKNDFIDLNPLILTHILSEVPLRVVKEGRKRYPKGEGWEVLSEEAHDSQDKALDPRLAKLKEFKFDK